MMMRPVFSLLSPAGAKARLSTLIFHRVLPEPDPLFPGEVHAQQFDQICAWVKRWFNVLPLDEAAAKLSSGKLPARALAITFDDGYADNHDVALPILHRHGLPATFFVATGFLDGGCMWNDRIVETIRRCTNGSIALDGLELAGLQRLELHSIPERKRAIETLIGAIKYLPVVTRLQLCDELSSRAQVKIPNNLMMSSSQVVALYQAGMQIGAHTVSHPILARMTDTDTRQEISNSKHYLESLLGEAVSLFAYPNGKPGEDYSPQTVEIVRGLGFDAAVSTQWGTSSQGDDLFQIRRFSPWDKTRLRFGLRMAVNLRK